MKTIFKYQLSEADNASLLRIMPNTFFEAVYKIAAFIILCVTMTVNAAYAQRDATHKTADSMLYLFAGAGKLFVQRQAFDQWTQANFAITKPYRPDVYADLGLIYLKYDFGVAANAGNAFETGGVYFGKRITGTKSPIGSWLNIEMGDFFGRFTDITPPTYNKVPAGQQLILSYNSFYISLTSKNYLNFLQYNAKIGRARIPVNMGFFVSAGWQPANGHWSYGYYDQDSVYHAQKLKPIPKLGKVQGTAGIFAGF